MAPASQPADHQQLQAAVSARYASLAQAAQAGQTVTDCDPGTFTEGGFGSAGCADTGELPDSAVRASLGCGNPVAVAELRPGETVLDLGSGGGIDVLLSARGFGPSGKAYGLDMTEEMLELARANARQAGAQNVEFLRGHIEAIPLPDQAVDVIISNCVINLSGDRPAVFAESLRVLRPGAAASASRTSSPTVRARCRGRLHRRGTHLCRIPRGPDPGRIHQHHHDPGPPGRRRPALHDHPRRQALASRFREPMFAGWCGA